MTLTGRARALQQERQAEERLKAQKIVQERAKGAGAGAGATRAPRRWTGSGAVEPGWPAPPICEVSGAGLPYRRFEPTSGQPTYTRTKVRIVIPCPPAKLSGLNVSGSAAANLKLSLPSS